MFCGNCGHQLPDGAQFCTNCGAKVNRNDNFPEENRLESNNPFPEENTADLVVDNQQPKKTRSKAPMIITIVASVLFVLLLGGAALYATVGLNMQKEHELAQIQDCGFPSYEEQAEKATEGWEDLGVLDIGKKREIIHELKLIRNNLDGFIEDQIDFYKDIDMSKAEESEVSSYETELETIETLIQGENWDYAAIKNAFDEMDDVVSMYIEPEKDLTIQVQQVDASEFPKIRLYLNVEDSASGEVPENLDGALFYIRKEDANANFIKQTVTEITQLNEIEALKVDMVVDVSGSMSGSPLNEAKSIMNRFIQSVQFGAGDLVEITSFSTGVRLEQEFCDDSSLLIQKINQLSTDDMTSLYDALYTAVERVAAQTGARCVIAFTDGNDNYSSCSQEDVIEVAKRYHVPVFIIGIGSIDSSQINYISSQTGGKYYNINDIDSMESIYQEIYQVEKELYLLEFEDSTGAAVDDQANIQVGYHSEEYGGECDYSYQPNVLLSATSDDIYTDGPEAVVEQYLKNFPDAVTQNDFSLISDCLKKGSDIYKTQEKFVQNDITEQLDTYELIDTSYSDDNHCIISTRETYYVQIEGKALQLLTQECEYALEKSGNKWEMTKIVDLKVVSRIKQ